MLRNMLSRRALLASVALALVGRLTRADDAKPKLSGKWAKKEADPVLEFSERGKLTIYPHGDGQNLEIECSYSASKDGEVIIQIKDFDGPDKVVEQLKALLPVGKEIRFKWKVEGDGATLDGMEGKDVDHVKARLEGEYAKKP